MTHDFQARAGVGPARWRELVNSPSRQALGVRRSTTRCRNVQA
jgi:hypothetical protein